MHIISKVKNSFYDLHTKRIYVNILELIKENQKNEQQKWQDNHSEILKDTLRDAYAYKKQKSDQAIKFLINSGYIKIIEVDELEITETGEQFLQKYSQFLLLNLFGKAGAVCEKNYVTSMIAIFTLIFSIIGIFAKVLWSQAIPSV